MSADRLSRVNLPAGKLSKADRERMKRADLVVRNGIVVKDRFGLVGVPVGKSTINLHRLIRGE